MKLKNNMIYNSAKKLIAFNIQQRLPVKINFFLQKNIKTIIEAAQEIDLMRINIAKQYGTPSEDGLQYHIPTDKEQLVQSELNDLFNLEQELNIYVFKLDDFENIDLTWDELSTIMFMIEE